ncbi:MAG: elongation factor P, partial [Kiritimatiellia bacterium]
MSYTAADLRKGLKIEIDGIPYEITEFQFVKPGKGQAMYKCRLKNMLAGNTMDRTFRSVDKIDRPNIESKTLHFSYQEGDKYIFMDNQTFEQVELLEDVVGDNRYFLLEDLECEILFY